MPRAQACFIYTIFCCAILFLVIGPNSATAQSGTFTLLDSITADGAYLKVDRLQQCYLVDSLNIINKYDRDGKLLFGFTNQRLGPLTQLDVTDPFSPLLYYPEFETIILLDRTLNVISEINLAQLGFYSVPLVAMARDNLIWIYDQQNFQLRKIDRQGNVLAESQNLSRWLEMGFNGTQLFSQGNSVYLQDPTYGVLVFNQFGQYLRTIAHLQTPLIGVFEEHFITLNSKEIRLFTSMLDDQESTLVSWKSPIRSAGISGDRVWLLASGKLYLLELD